MEPVSPGSHRREKCATRTVPVTLVRTNFCKTLGGGGGLNPFGLFLENNDVDRICGCPYAAVK